MTQEHNPVNDTILIREKVIPVKTTMLDHNDLRFFVENPRIYSVLRRHGSDEPSQEAIQTKLLEMEHVRKLIQDIRDNGGLTDPIIVRRGKLEVLEGNSRLAAYRKLAKLNPVKWSKIKACLLPEDIDESLIFSLLGQYHLKGKTPGIHLKRRVFSTADIGTTRCLLINFRKKLVRPIRKWEKW